MCLGKAYLEANGKNELVLDSVSLVEVSDTGLKLSTIFGDTKEFDAKLKEIDFEKSQIMMKAVPARKK
ncbi:MAG: CooT family nickel-binding protein [Dehalococcoidia bacterium]|nr:CooT family nickel-binding protein [Dehalococcoidia bacterium]